MSLRQRFSRLRARLAAAVLLVQVILIAALAINMMNSWERIARDNLAKRIQELNLLFDRAEKAGRLHGLVNDGRWFHIGTPSGLAIAKRELPRFERRARAG